MNFSQLVDEVYIITGRLDRAAETESAVRAATLKAHNSDFFSRDIYETSVDFTENNYRQSIDLYTLINNFRAMKYLRPYNAADVADGSDITGPFIDVITPEEVLDSYGRNRSNIAYVAGRMLEVRAACAFDTAMMGCYVYPIITPSNEYSSWIANLQPWAIINEAARVIFKMIGKAEESNSYAQLVAEEYALLKITGLSDVGY